MIDLKSPVIAAIRTEKELNAALNSKCDIIFDLNPDLFTVAENVKKVHDAGKKLCIHIDFASGIGKDKTGIQFAKHAGVDGIISTRVNIIRLAREEGIFTIQRFFIVDSRSVDTTAESLKASRPDMIEIMPGILPKVISDLKSKAGVPIIAGGLIEEKEEISKVIESGAAAVSTGKQELWGIKSGK